ncbi:B-cell receptor CD22-like [Scyliorhinus canicula]|uniref:B-cell receptor CD22-like n=1 Tax=Scyliorhinus canicula TaxID=7830 RepID=UPI0018F30F8C|nr:B-cell receptor CD22-like [Scyliorhinus canicula]
MYHRASPRLGMDKPRNLSMSSLDMIDPLLINIIEGNSAVIICSVESFPASNLTWRHLNVTMNRTSSNNELWLVIPHVTSMDTGDYECAAENEHGAVEGSITITVEHPPQETMVSISTSSDGIREGSNITLTCSSESVPPISHYTWFRIEENTSIQLNTSSRTLSFTPVTRENDGSFYCTVRNPLGNSTSNITHLDVEYKPEISQESECSQRSEGVTCICVANSNPPGDLTWHLPRANISGNQTHGRLMSWWVRDGHLVIGSLILMGPQDEEEVTASCSVQNPHGKITAKVHLSAKGRDSSQWTVGLLTAGIILGIFVAGILTFVCLRKRKITGDLELFTKHQGLELSALTPNKLESKKLMKYLGVDNDQEIIPPSDTSPSWTVTRVERQHSRRGNSTGRFVCTDSMSLQLPITFGKPTPTRNLDTGDYECVAENEHGAVEGSITITVEYPPQETMVSISSSSDGIREGSNITLTCSSESVPPISHYTWFRIEGNTSIQLNTSSRFLSFTPVTRENDGSFYCTVRNPLGNSTSNITHLDVQYNPEISQELECTRRSEGVTCICVANSNPTGDLTWHLPPAKISGNQTHGRLVSWRVRDGHLVIGSLILMGPQDEKGVMISCSVRNPHGEAMFKVYLWV